MFTVWMSHKHDTHDKAFRILFAPPSSSQNHLERFARSLDISIIFFIFSPFRSPRKVWMGVKREQRFIILFIFTLIHFSSHSFSIPFSSCSYFYDLLHVLWHRHKMNGAEREMKDTAGSWSRQSLIHRLLLCFFFICFWWCIWARTSASGERKNALIYRAFWYEFLPVKLSIALWCVLWNFYSRIRSQRWWEILIFSHSVALISTGKNLHLLS